MSLTIPSNNDEWSIVLKNYNVMIERSFDEDKLTDNKLSTEK